jgi:hypothetical protein
MVWLREMLVVEKISLFEMRNYGKKMRGALSLGYVHLGHKRGKYLRTINFVANGSVTEGQGHCVPNSPLTTFLKITWSDRVHYKFGGIEIIGVCPPFLEIGPQGSLIPVFP